MFLSCFAAVLCAYGAVMAVWSLFGRWMGAALTTCKCDWLGLIYKK